MTLLWQNTPPDWRETQALELLHLSKRQIPLIFVGRILQRETVAEFYYTRRLRLH